MRDRSGARLRRPAQQMYSSYVDVFGRGLRARFCAKDSQIVKIAHPVQTEKSVSISKTWQTTPAFQNGAS